MNIEERIRSDLWKAINAHYDRKDYTESVRDSVYQLSELLREKSGFEDLDGSKLVEKSMLGNNPVILVNKNETTTEKDFQQGIGFSLKGIMQAIRNPISHEKTTFSQEDAEAIILYINFLMNQIDRSGGTTKIENVMELLMDEDFTDTEEYADLLLKEVPIKKRYDLILEIFNTRTNLSQNNLRFFIPALFNSLTKAAKTDFCRVVSDSMMKCKDDNYLRMYCHYFYDLTYSSIDKLSQLRIESLLLRSIKKGKYVNEEDVITGTKTRKINPEGTLATWFSGKLYLLPNNEAIYDEIFKRTLWGEDIEEYIFKCFSKDMERKPDQFSASQINTIKSRLINGDTHYYYWLFDKMEIIKDESYIELFGKEYSICSDKIPDTELPF